MNYNATENVIAFDERVKVGGHDDPLLNDPLNDLLYEFENVPIVEGVGTVLLPKDRPEFYLMSENQLLDYIEHKIRTLSDRVKRSRYLTKDIDLFSDT